MMNWLAFDELPVDFENKTATFRCIAKEQGHQSVDCVLPPLCLFFTFSMELFGRPPWGRLFKSCLEGGHVARRLGAVFFFQKLVADICRLSAKFLEIYYIQQHLIHLFNPRTYLKFRKSANIAEVSGKALRLHYGTVYAIVIRMINEKITIRKAY